MRRATGSVYLALAFALSLFGQATPNRPSFEVASVKINTTGMRSDRVPRRSGDRVTMHYVNLTGLLTYAYGIENPMYQFVDDTDPLGETWFDVDAIAPVATGDADLRLMFQTLLEDRFKLKVHWETRELPGYDLVAAKGGSKMKLTSPDKKITVDGNVFPMGTSQLYVAANHVAHLIGKGSSMEQLVYQLSGRVRTPVRDRTDLTGAFDYDVIFALDDLHVDVNSPPMVTTAIQDELGLKLDKSKIPVKVLIVDHAEKATSN